MKNIKEKVVVILRYLPLLMTLAAIIVYILNRDSLTAESISGVAPENAALAVLFILFIAALKSVSVFFPFFIVEVISTLLFPKGIAIIINIAAICVSFLTAYAVGRLSGSGMIEKLRKKYEKFNDFQGMIEKNKVFAVFALRIIGILPMDTVSMYLGAMKTDVLVYLAASLAGGMPDLILETIIGDGIKNPGSTSFFVAIAIRLSLSLLSLYIYRRYVTKKQVKKSETK